MLISNLSRKLTPAGRLEHERLTSLINSMADGVIAVDKQVRIVIYNGAALNILDVNTPAQNKSLGDILHPIGKDDEPVDIVKLVEATKLPEINRDLRLKYADGSIINLYLSIAPVHLGYGVIGQRGFVILLRDITREKSLEEERDEFISVVSHELRTPITISEGNISNAQLVVERGGDMEQVKKGLEEAHNQILFLGGLINDLSMLSRAERGKLTLEAETIDIPKFIAELASNYQTEAATKGLKLHSKVDSQALVLRSSTLYVREILQNFITNALKYTEKGSISLGAKRHKTGIEFTVSDTGIGIGKGDQKRVFEKFFRSENYHTRKTSGTGLGLYVTAKLASLLKADITLKSELNKGSSFTIIIPNIEDK